MANKPEFKSAFESRQDMIASMEERRKAAIEARNKAHEEHMAMMKKRFETK